MSSRTFSIVFHTVSRASLLPDLLVSAGNKPFQRSGRFFAFPLAWLLLIPILFLAPANSDNLKPELRISIYGVVQDDAPVNIVGFHYKINEIDVDIFNKSDKAVSGLTVFGAIATPAGCSFEEAGDGSSILPQKLAAFQIAPHHLGTLSDLDAPFSPSGLVLAAQNRKAAGLSVHVGVVEVGFADGTIWRHGPQHVRPSTGSNADQCSDPSDALHLLSSVRRISFGGRVPAQVVSPKKERPAIAPSLLFHCTFVEDAAGRTDAECPETSNEKDP